MTRLVDAMVSNVELNGSYDNVDVVEGVEPSINATSFGCGKVNPESNDDRNNIDPSESLFKVWVIHYKPHPDNVDHEPNC